MHDLTVPLGPLLVLDIETVPDPRSVAIAGRGGQISRPGLHRVVAASTLAATETRNGEWTGVEIASASGANEHVLLAEMSAWIHQVASTGGTLVTFNGSRHDVPVLRRRAQANWAFALDGLADLDGIPHIDLSRIGSVGQLPPTSLRDACAGLGLTIDHIAIPYERDPLAAPVRKSQCDVCGTLLLLLHEIALARKSPKPLVAGWRALTDHLAMPGTRAPHLEQFRMRA